jgi:hypothetical protein
LVGQEIDQGIVETSQPAGFFLKKVEKSFWVSGLFVIFTYNLKTTNTMDIKTQIHQVAMTRSLIDIETSLLLNIKTNLQDRILEDFPDMDEMTKQVIRSTWKAEIANIDLELTKRN